MLKRKGYRKIRGGCMTCKERKVRCSLERPVCGNCSRLSRPCAYAIPASGQDTAQRPFNRPISHLISIPDVELMHHYMTSTHSTMSGNPVLVSLWREVVPKHAFKHPFLLRGLLAITAQHKIYLNEGAKNRTDLIDTANIYQQEALATYIRLLDDITEETCHALFAFSQVIVGISYSRLCLDIYGETRDSLGLIASMEDIFDLLKGAFAIAYKASTWLKAGDLAPMMSDMPTPSLPKSPSASLDPCLRELSSLSNLIVTQMGNSIESKARSASLLSTIELLKTIFDGDFEPKDKVNRIVGLPVWLDTNYLSLLKARDHAALIVLAYYGIALHMIRDGWCFKGIGAKIVHAVTALLSDEWSTYLIFPRMEIRAEV